MNFDEALENFSKIIKYAVFFTASSKSDDIRLKEIVHICTEYILLIKLNYLSEESKADKVKCCEIRLKMSLCKLEKPIHSYLVLKKTKIACKNIKNYLTAIVFLKKLISIESAVYIIIYAKLS